MQFILLQGAFYVFFIHVFYADLLIFYLMSITVKFRLLLNINLLFTHTSFDCILIPGFGAVSN